MNSPDSSISVWLCRVGERLIAKRGGLVEVGIAQVTVVMFGLAPFPIDESTTSYTITNEEGNHVYYLGTKYFVDGNRPDDTDNHILSLFILKYVYLNFLIV